MVNRKFFLRTVAMMMVLFFCMGIFSFVSYAQDGADTYSFAVEAASKGDPEFAYMYFSAILRDYPHSKYAKSALFAIGEYSFSIGNYPDSIAAFTKFIGNYPKAKERICALGYLLAIAQKGNKDALVKSLEEEIQSFQQAASLFKKHKEYVYKSPFLKKHKVVYCIDKIEFYVDEELLTKTSF